MSVYATANLSFLGFGFVGNSTPTHMVLKGYLFLVCIVWDIAVHAAMDEVTADAMVVAVNDGVSILITSSISTVLLGVSFGFIWCGVFTIFLMLKFCAIDFYHHFV